MKTIKQIIRLALIAVVISGCQKYLDNTPLPTNGVIADAIFDTDNTTGTVLAGIFLSITNTGSYSSGAGSTLSYTTSFYADEMKPTINGNIMEVFYKNKIQPANSPFWKEIYQKIFMVNTAIEGINSSKGKLEYKNQWLGECYFLRAFFYYQLFNIYGPVPLALTGDWERNNKLFRSPEAEVHQQIIADLKLAKSMLSDTYRNGNAQTTANRFRPNKAAASTMLARMYLYTKDWDNARTEASEVITNNSYELVPINDIFLLNSKETIWSLANGTPKANIPYTLYNRGIPAILSARQTPASFNVFGSMSEQLLAAFETGDARYSSWIYTVNKAATQTQPAMVYRIPNKYRSAANTTENQIVLRLAELYLIRAEAKFMLNDPTADEDLNRIRRRAGLDDIHPSDFLTALVKEKQVELLTENGQRFFDLKRMGKLDAIMTSVVPSKASTWESYMANWPIPSAEMIQNPNITPNPGYVQ